ncbi:MAG TPA: DinB family protein [Planctomycetota bacterium]|nr:DinB family protein [Planctomycetota bacterium]
MQRPPRDEFPASFQPYVDGVPDGDVLVHLARQGAATAALLRTVDEARGMFRYAPGKWSVKSVVQHVTDGERLFCYRALCLARGETNPLPGFDENLYAANDGAAGRQLADIVQEFVSVRAATGLLFAGFDAAAWARRGIANGKAVSVRALPWIIAGHELHHLSVLRDRYDIR